MNVRIYYRTFYLILLSMLLLVSIIAFSFFVLIPKGKEYRSLRLENKKEQRVMDTAREHYDTMEGKLQKLQEKNKETIKAYRTVFNPEKFTRLNRSQLQDLFLTEIHIADQNKSFKVYEVNATTKITSPEVFYHFLEKVNHSGWIIGVHFPVHFERDKDLIKLSFTMKVHHLSEEKKEE
ncbi:MAG: hypothetical protein PHQ22_08015 [Sulfuricurvum sp.]|nr:hypothetical protein [Sulfuricurvum sp.]MDD5387120.1 hypothetical protein [Sulfuricurvum sp.]